MYAAELQRRTLGKFSQRLIAFCCGSVDKPRVLARICAGYVKFIDCIRLHDHFAELYSMLATFVWRFSVNNQAHTGVKACMNLQLTTPRRAPSTTLLDNSLILGCWRQI